MAAIPILPFASDEDRLADEEIVGELCAYIIECSTNDLLGDWQRPSIQKEDLVNEGWVAALGAIASYKADQRSRIHWTGLVWRRVRDSQIKFLKAHARQESYQDQEYIAERTQESRLARLAGKKVSPRDMRWMYGWTNVVRRRFLVSGRLFSYWEFSKDQVAVVMAHLDKLPERERRAVVMRLTGHQIEDITGRLGCTEKTVRNLLKRGRETLARYCMAA